MIKRIKINKGLDIPIQGVSEKVVENIDEICKYAIKPTDFFELIPKLLVQEGDKVKAGTPLFYDKKNEKIKITSPISGTIELIKRGDRRLLEEIIIIPDKEIEYEFFAIENISEINRLNIINKLLDSGLWATIRQRPYNIIANPLDIPKAIFISGFDSSPLAPDYDLIIHGQGINFQAGLDVLKKLTDGVIHLSIKEEEGTSKVFLNSKNIQINYIYGPHPAGNIGTQIHHIDPINKGEIVWHINPQDIVSIGKLFTEGIYDSTKIIALTGPEVITPKYYRIKNGASISSIVKNKISDKKLRIISGNVLNGDKVENDGFIGFYHSQITVIEEGNEPEFLGWALPGLNKHSFSRTFLSKLFPFLEYKFNCNYHGGERAFVVTGEFEKVFPMDIYPVYLLKSILAKDIEQMENLGIYEVADEDFGLCDYVCTSKIETQEIVREGLRLMIKEMS